MNEIGAGLIGIAASIALEKLVDYSGLGDYLKEQGKRVFNSHPFAIFKPWYKDETGNDVSGAKLFWERVFQKKITIDTNIHLEEFALSEWFPRKPGLYWTGDAKTARHHAKFFIVESDEKSVTYSWQGKKFMAELGGVGAIKYSQNKPYVPMTLTPDGIVHSGIPILVSQEVMEKINKARLSNRLLRVSLKGILKDVPDSLQSRFHRQSNIPRVAVQVDSRLDVELSKGDIPEIVTPWTLYRRRKEVGDPFGFSYVTCNLGSDDLSEKIEWMKDNVRANDGVTILTDFDQNHNSLDAVFPLNDTITSPEFNKKLFRYLQDMKTEFPELATLNLTSDDEF